VYQCSGRNSGGTADNSGEISNKKPANANSGISATFLDHSGLVTGMTCKPGVSRAYRGAPVNAAAAVFNPDCRMMRVHNILNRGLSNKKMR
jgi:hypothetical protein